MFFRNKIIVFITFILLIINISFIRIYAKKKDEVVVPIIDSWLYVKGNVLKEIPLGKKVELIDKVYYGKLKPNEEYTIIGTLMTKKGDGKYTEYKKDGKSVTVSNTFRTRGDEKGDPYGAYGEEWLNFQEIDTTELDADAMSVKVELFPGKEKKDLDTSSTTTDGIVFPAQVLSEESDHFLYKTSIEAYSHEPQNDNCRINIINKEKAVFVESVKYKNLTPDMSYKLVCNLCDKKTGNMIEIENGMMSKEKIFVARQESGDVDIEIELDVSDRKEKEIVISGYLYNLEGSLIAVQDDLNCSNQTIQLYKEDLKAIKEKVMKQENKKSKNNTMTDSTPKDVHVNENKNKSKDNNSLQLIVYLILISASIEGFLIYNRKHSPNK